MELPILKLRPNDRLLENKAGEVWHRAGDTKRRKLLRDFERAQLDAQRNDPDKIAKREAEGGRVRRARLEANVSSALSGIENLKKSRARLIAERDDALDNSRNLGDIVERHAALAEAESFARKLRQIPAALKRAEAALVEARAALLQHDEAVNARAAQRAVIAEKDAYRAAREEAAWAKAKELFDRLMEGDDVDQ